MSVGGIGSRSALQVQSLLDMRRQLDDLQRQLGTGKKADTYADAGVDRGLAIGLRSQLAAIGTFTNAIGMVDGRLKVAQTALTDIEAAATDVKHSMVKTSFVLDQNGQTVEQNAARSQLDRMLASLNTRYGDQYIFSGRSPDKAAVEPLAHILGGDGARAGFKQVMAERKEADLGGGLGRLVVPAAAGTSVTMAEDAVSPFGLTLGAVNSGLTGATVTGPAGSPPSVSVDLGAVNPNVGDAITFNFTLPDGSTESLTLTATTAASGPGQFAIGATSAATAANLQAALTAGVGKLADTKLVVASAFAAADDFFNTDAAHPPQRVAGPPFATATARVAGTDADTVTWYTGEAGSDPARATALARIDSSILVSYGMRANEAGLRSPVAAIAVFATMSFSPSDPDGAARYAGLTQHLDADLAARQGVHTITDIEADVAGAQTAMAAAKDRHQQNSSALTDLLQSIEGAPLEQVAAQILALHTSLQASLQTTALLSKMSLVNYL
jgi:flagellin-like hook-associated protein FlgL